MIPLLHQKILVSKNLSPFRKNVKRKNVKITITINNKVSDKKLEYNINKEAAKISALPTGKIDKYEYLTDKEILPSVQTRIVEQTKFPYSPLRIALEKQTKTIEEQGEKQIKLVENTLKN